MQSRGDLGVQLGRRRGRRRSRASSGLGPPGAVPLASSGAVLPSRPPSSFPASPRTTPTLSSVRGSSSCRHTSRLRYTGSTISWPPFRSRTTASSGRGSTSASPPPPVRSTFLAQCVKETIVYDATAPMDKSTYPSRHHIELLPHHCIRVEVAGDHRRKGQGFPVSQRDIGMHRRVRPEHDEVP